MPENVDLDDAVRQDDWVIQPTHRDGEYALSHDGLHTRFHAARATASDGIRQVELVQHADHADMVVATVTTADVPWRIEEWLRTLAAETSYQTTAVTEADA